MAWTYFFLVIVKDDDFDHVGEILSPSFQNEKKMVEHFKNHWLDVGGYLFDEQTEVEEDDDCVSDCGSDSGDEPMKEVSWWTLGDDCDTMDQCLQAAQEAIESYENYHLIFHFNNGRTKKRSLP